MGDWNEKLNENERFFILREPAALSLCQERLRAHSQGILAFFAASDGIVGGELVGIQCSGQSTS